MWGEPDAQVQVARLRASAAALALARNADARSVADAGRNADVDGARVTVVLDRQPAHRAVVRILEAELELLLHVAPGVGAPAGATARARPGFLTGPAAAEERLKEIGERVRIAEHLAHLVFGHRAETAALRRAAAAEMDVPSRARLARIESRTRSSLLVHAPVGTELVVLLALLGIAEHFVRFVELFEPGFGRLVARIDVGMVLPRQLAVRLLDFLLRGCLRHAERRIVVFEIHCSRCRLSRIRASGS